VTLAQAMGVDVTTFGRDLAENKGAIAQLLR
jgi:hypothetical protein